MKRVPPPPKNMPVVAAFEETKDNPPPSPPPPPRGASAPPAPPSEDVELQAITSAEPWKKPPEKKGKDKDAGAAAGAVAPRGGPGQVFNDDRERFVGKKLLQFALWAHYMSYGAALLTFFLGIFAILWVTSPYAYDCSINGKPIHFTYYNSTQLANGNYGNCTNVVQLENGKRKLICCFPNKQNPYPALLGDNTLGAVYFLYSLALIALENTDWGYGLYYPIDTFMYKYRFSLCSLVNFGLGAWGLTLPVTSLAGACLIALGCVQAKAAYRREAGDGGRGQRRAKMVKNEAPEKPYLEQFTDLMTKVFKFRPYKFYRRILTEDKLTTYFWVFFFLGINCIYFFYTLHSWYGIVGLIRGGYLHGGLAMGAKTRLAHSLRQGLKYGPPTYYAAWAKGCGTCLNMNCALLLLPVVRLLLRRLNNTGVSFSKSRPSGNDWFSKFFAHPFTRYVPLQRNIEFHKMCALMVFMMSLGHLVMHYCNLAYANRFTQAFFRNYLHPSFPMFNWSGAAFLTGSVIIFAMFMIYSAAPDAVRLTRYEIFFLSHHFFTVFFLFLFIHAPNAFFWSMIPAALYCYERYLQTKRGNRSFLLCKVEYIPPVMAVYFRPSNKKHFQFKEGQYLYLNCPYVSKNEWHPFTISSALDDLNNGPRVDVLTGEQVTEVPRPTNLPEKIKWRKYCHISDDWRKMAPEEFLEKGDTAFMDYVTCHIKIHGMEDRTAKTWTRRTKEYFELLQGAPPGEGKFPMFFHQNDGRGEYTIGKRYGPDGQQILRVDGPHSAPSEHYSAYGTLMIVGAGIGLTPCASILTALTKYRWRKNFNPEILHFYWIVRQNEVESFQWLVHMLTEISCELKTQRETKQIEPKYYCEMNIYVTGVDKKPLPVKPLHIASRPLGHEAKMRGLQPPTFSAEQLYAAMLNPTVESKNQIEKMRQPNPANRLQDIWIWNGRPMWDEVFQEMKDQRQHSDIGVCFCGAPVIGADLSVMCEKYSSKKDDIMFNLHKENF